MKPLEIQIAQHHFNSKIVHKKQRTAGGIPHLKPTDSVVTKHSDYFVWKETSERMARPWRCGDTVDKKRVNSCQLKHLFLDGGEQPRISSKEPGNAVSDALLMTCFQIWHFVSWHVFVASAAKIWKLFFKKFFETALHAVFINSLIRINSRPKILRSCFLHWLYTQKTQHKY